MNKSYTKKALALSIMLLIVWGLLGAGTTVAWFTDTTPTHKNTFYTGELDLQVKYKAKDGNYYELKEDSNIFDDSALYEPGYTQVAYLEIANIGDIAFDYTTAITVSDYTNSINKYGVSFNLIPYLYHGTVTADTESELNALLDTREKALSYSTIKLNNYTPTIDTLKVNQKKYIALIVNMPTYVGNEANHQGNAPEIKLGINIKASQQGTLN